MSLFRRTVRSISWRSAATLVRVPILLVRAVLLMRWLSVADFGIYATATLVIQMTVILPSFGMGAAFMHRSQETLDEEATAATHFTLKLIFTAIWLLLLASGALLLTDSMLRVALLVTAAATAAYELTGTPRLILTRRIEHGRLAMIEIAGAVLTTAVAVGAALLGGGIWALLTIPVVTAVTNVLLLYAWRPVWQPRWSWDNRRIWYFLRFGRHSFAAGALLRILDRIGDLWVRVFIGETALGFYSRAYALATYPRRIVAMPVNTVALSTYAEASGNRRILSQAFFRTSALLVRTGFLLAGLLALIAPEFIHLAVGSKWLPMLPTFRLLLLFTLLDPLTIVGANLFMAIGRPGFVMRVRVIQLATLVLGLFLLGWLWGIAGVAVSLVMALLVGITILFWQAQSYVDISLLRLFLVPTAALVLAMMLATLSSLLPVVQVSDGRTAAAKTICYLIVFACVLLACERREAAWVFRSVGLPNAEVTE